MAADGPLPLMQTQKRPRRHGAAVLPEAPPCGRRTSREPSRTPQGVCCIRKAAPPCGCFRRAVGSPKGGAALWAAEPKKERHLLLADVFLFWYARRDSNPQHSEPESDALSIELRAHLLSCSVIIADSPPLVKGQFFSSRPSTHWMARGGSSRAQTAPRQVSPR